MKKGIFPVVLVVAVMSLSNVARADCVNATSLTLASILAGGGIFSLGEAAPPNGVECLAVTITDFTFASTANVLMFESDNATASDLVTFSNNTLNQATICFGSDPNILDSCTPLTSADHIFTISEDPTLGGGITLPFGDFSVTALSDAPVIDTEPGSEPSDALVFTATTPEPNPLVLLGIGLAGLVAVRRYRRRLSC